MYCVLTCNRIAHFVLWLSAIRVLNVTHFRWKELPRLDGSELISAMWCYIMSPSERRSVASVVCTGQYDNKRKDRLQEQGVR